MISKYTLETHRRVYDDEEGVSIQIRPSPDNPDQYIEITTEHDKASAEYFGEFRLALPNSMASLLGQALIAQTEAEP